MNLLAKLPIQIGILVTVIMGITVGALLYFNYSEYRNLAAIEKSKVESNLNLIGDELRVYWANDLIDAFDAEVTELSENIAVKNVEVLPWAEVQKSSFDVIFPSKKDEFFDFYLVANIDHERIKGNVRHNESITVVVLGMMTILLVLFIGFYRFFKFQVYTPLLELHRSLSSEQEEGASGSMEKFDMTEIIQKMKGLLDVRIAYERKSMELNSQKKVNELVKKAAHDIRSPLAALNMLSLLSKKLNDGEKAMLSGAIKRINKIATEFLNYTRRHDELGMADGPAKSRKSTKVIHLSVALEEIIDEKRLEYIQAPKLHIDWHAPQPIHIFVKCNETELKRSLSNLINNAVEAQGREGVIRVRAVNCDGEISISVTDEGCGMSPELIADVYSGQLQSRKKQGFGIGLKGALNFAQSNTGHLNITSKPNVGTIVTMTLPAVKTPSYFVEKLEVDQFDEIISFDDDPSIVSTFGTLFNDLPVRFFGMTDIEKIKGFLEQKMYSDKVLFLVDYDLSKDDFNGVNLIEKYGIQKQSILFTYRNMHSIKAVNERETSIKYYPKKYMQYFVQQ